jgi:hypothetical protein
LRNRALDSPQSGRSDTDRRPGGAVTAAPRFDFYRRAAAVSAAAWAGVELRIVDAAHEMQSGGMVDGLIEATDRFSHRG